MDDRALPFYAQAGRRSLPTAVYVDPLAMLPHPPSAIAEAVSKYKPRLFGPAAQDGTATGRVGTAGGAGGAGSGGAVPPLALLCLEAVAANFHLFPSLDGLHPKFATAITSSLPLDLDVAVAGPYVHDENYWKRVCLEEQKWENCQIVNHGMSWKQLFFERYLSETLEHFGVYPGSTKAHEDEFLRPPIDSSHPKWKVLYPDVVEKIPPTNVLPNRERYCCNGAECDAVRIMNSPNSGWPGLERCKAAVPANIQQFAESYAWAMVPPGDVTAAKAATAEAEASLVSTLGGSNFMKGDGLLGRTGAKATASLSGPAATTAPGTAASKTRLAVGVVAADGHGSFGGPLAGEW